MHFQSTGIEGKFEDAELFVITLPERADGMVTGHPRLRSQSNMREDDSWILGTESSANFISLQQYGDERVTQLLDQNVGLRHWSQHEEAARKRRQIPRTYGFRGHASSG